MALLSVFSSPEPLAHVELIVIVGCPSPVVVRRQELLQRTSPP